MTIMTVHFTLVIINACFAITAISLFTFAAETTLGIYANCILVTRIESGGTFVDILAQKAISSKSEVTTTLIRPRFIDTFGMNVTFMRFIDTFIYIGTAKTITSKT